jgi:hypothetical protein
MGRSRIPKGVKKRGCGDEIRTLIAIDSTDEEGSWGEVDVESGFTSTSEDSFKVLD